MSYSIERDVFDLSIKIDERSDIGIRSKGSSNVNNTNITVVASSSQPEFCRADVSVWLEFY